MPYCNQCGAQNPEGSAFCSSCGSSIAPKPQETSTAQSTYSQPVYPQPAYTSPLHQSAPAYVAPRLPTAANVLSIVSMACGIASCATLFMGFLFSIAALITSGISRSKTPYGVSNTKAKVGLITGIVGIVLSVIWIIIYVELLGEIFDIYDYYDYGYGYYYDF